MASHSAHAKKSKSKDAKPAEKRQSDALPHDVMDKVIAKFKGKPGALLGTLEELQGMNKYKYLPASTLEYVAEKLEIAPSQVFGVATFYSYFNLKPQGEHCITICRGTACHTKGSRNLLDGIKEFLKLKEDPAEEGEKIFLTTDDRLFTLKTIACFGQCALAPVCEIDGVIYSNVTNDKLRKIVSDLKKGGK